MKDDKKFECYLNPQNEGHDMAYVERFQGTLAELTARCTEIQTGLQKLLPDASITINIETYTGDVRFNNGKFFKDGDEILDNKLLTQNIQ